MMGVDDLLGETDFDLSDLEAALARVKPGARRPAPTYYEVDVTLEELFLGCVKNVPHERTDAQGRRKQVELKISVPRGAVGGTEFVFRHMGSTPGGSSTAGDVILVLREADHPSLVRHGDDLVHVSCKEAQAADLLLTLEVPLAPNGNWSPTLSRSLTLSAARPTLAPFGRCPPYSGS